MWQRNIQQGHHTVLPVSPPHITPGLEVARGPREKSGRGFVLHEQITKPAGASLLEWSESSASACYMLQQKSLCCFLRATIL